MSKIEKKGKEHYDGKDGNGRRGYGLGVERVVFNVDGMRLPSESLHLMNASGMTGCTFERGSPDHKGSRVTIGIDDVLDWWCKG